jgi:Glycosyl transferase family 90
LHFPNSINRIPSMGKLISVLLIPFGVFAALFASPEWMGKQIADDLSPFQREGFCPKCLIKFFDENKDNYLLCLFTIKSNNIYYKTANNIPATYDRLCVIVSALKKLAEQFHLPDVVFLVSLHDSLDNPSPFPIFVMSKKCDDQKILFPDFEALASRYQVIEGINLEVSDFPIPWIEREDLLVWRGSGAQGEITPNNMTSKSRVTLCQLSLEYPHMIDAGFTFCIPSCIERYKKAYLPIEKIFSHRYQIWLDGNAASYSNSGWRLYTGSTVLKPTSPYIQWYYGDLKPWVHYVPVKDNLEDLIDTLLFLQANVCLAEQVAQNGIQFAREHITQKQNLLYLHDLLWAYYSLPTTLACP